MIMDILDLAGQYAEAWKKLDVSIVAPYLSDDFTYGSMWVFESLDKKRYIDYLEGKFKTIAATSSRPRVDVVKSENGDICVHLDQGGNIAFIHIKVSDDKITEAYMMSF